MHDFRTKKFHNLEFFSHSIKDHLNSREERKKKGNIINMYWRLKITYLLSKSFGVWFLLVFLAGLLVVFSNSSSSSSWPWQQFTTSSSSDYFASHLELSQNYSLSIPYVNQGILQDQPLKINSIPYVNQGILQDQPLQRKEEEVGFKGTRNASSKKERSNLEVLEAGLGEARFAIREAKVADENIAQEYADFVPKGPMYFNATAFLRSYLEMEKRLKVFVYNEGDPPIFHFGPCKQTYAIEGYFIQAIEISHFRTNDPSKAHLFFLPISITMLTKVVYVPNSHQWTQMKNTASDYINVISHKYPYWNQSLGADHFMLACHDWGPEISFSVPYLYQNSIRALCNANTSEKFNPSKDVSIPEIHLPWGTTDGLLGGPSPSKRPVLVFYAGGIHGPIRPILLKYWENKDEDVQIYKYLPKGISYYGMMRKSKYCICPSGFEVASPRMVEALYVGCVPVLIKDGYVMPFSDVLDWKTFSVIIPVKDIPNLKKILMGISQRKYIKMQRRGRQVRRHFEVNSPPKPFDVFHMILHSIWLRRLNFRVYDHAHES